MHALIGKTGSQEPARRTEGRKDGRKEGRGTQEGSICLALWENLPLRVTLGFPKELLCNSFWRASKITS